MPITETRQNGVWVRRLKSAVALFVAFCFWLAQMHAVYAAIDNSALAVGVHNGVGISSNVSTQSVPVIVAAPQLNVSKTGVLNDDDGTPGLSVGDTISYTVTANNTGNVSLTGIVVNDPLVALTLQSGDADSDNEIDPGEAWIYTGSYTITATDLGTNGGGDGDIDNTVSVTTNETGLATASHETPINPSISLVVTKTGVLNDDDGIAGLSAGDTIDYQISISNIGATDLTTINVSDTLVQSAMTTTLVPVFTSGDVNSDGRINAGENWLYSVSYTLTQANIDDGGNLVNTATVTTDQSGPRTADDTQMLSGIIEAYTMTKIANLVDADGDGLGDVGENINYIFRFTNTGNRTLANLSVTDPLPGLSAISCSNDGDSDGDIDLLAPGQVLDCAATYAIAAGDLVAGSVTNTATSSATRFNGLVPVSEDDTANDNSTTTNTDSNFDLDVEKTVLSATEILPNIVEIDYQITIRNLSAVTQGMLRVEDDVSAAIPAPAEIIGNASIVSTTGFTGPGIANPAFNGIGSNQIFAGDVQLVANATGTVIVRVLFDRKGQSINTSNTARASSDLVPVDVPSDDPGKTPDNPNDVNPTVHTTNDADGDGAPDGNESSSGDRDGDGIADAQDYDPTGYFYCEADGQILAGGRIAVENLATGGIQAGIGSSNNITIVRDGSAGEYQFYVTAPGTYRLIPTLPPTGVASTTRPSAGQLDVTSLLPANPGVLGAGEIRNTRVLNDFSASSNPFYTEFRIERGDPSVFNNNIPLELCGTPNVTVSKEVAAAPEVQPDNTSNLTYRITLGNNGTNRADDVTANDNLDSVFGAGNFTILGRSIESSPAGFGAAVNPFYDGVSNTDLLTSGGNLQPGETVSILLQLNVDVPTSQYNNTVIAGGVHPLTRVPIEEASASVSVNIISSGARDGVIATKTTPIDAAPLGARVPYTVSFENTNSLAVRGADFIDLPPFGFTYVPGTARVNGNALEPIRQGQELVWAGQDIAPGQRVTITLQLQVGAGVKGTEFTNTAFVRDSVDGKTISNRAKAVVRLEIESVFHCSHVIGRVFDDLDQDGYYDVGEPGLGGVRVATVNGKLITTDQFGRYHITCDAVPDDRIGSNYILKLDEKTLPTGYRSTSENPRVIRLTRGKLSKINFAAANLRRITLALNNASFHENSVSLKPNSIRDIARTLPILEEDRSVLELYYNDGDALKSQRLKAVKKLINKAWQKRKRPHRLEIDIIEKR